MDAKRLEKSFIKYLRWHSPVSTTLRDLGILENIPAGALGEGLDAYFSQSVAELSSDLAVKMRDLSPQVLHVTEFAATQGERFARELATVRDSLSALIETDRQLAQEVGDRYLYEWGFSFTDPLDPNTIVELLSEMSAVMHILSQNAYTHLEQFSNRQPGALAAITLLPKVDELTTDDLLSLCRGDRPPNWLNPSDYLEALFIALFLGRPDMIPKIQIRVAKALQEARRAMSDFNSDSVSLLLEEKTDVLTGRGFLNGHATKSTELLLEALNSLLNFPLADEVNVLPRPARTEIGTIIYTDIWHRFGEVPDEEFGYLVIKASDEVLRGYSWEGLDEYAQASNDSLGDHMRQIKSLAEDLFNKAKLSRLQRKVLELEAILSVHEEHWNQRDKASWLGMKQNQYRQHFYQGRQKVLRAMQDTKPMDGEHRLLRAIFYSDT